MGLKAIEALILFTVLASVLEFSYGSHHRPLHPKPSKKPPVVNPPPVEIYPPYTGGSPPPVGFNPPATSSPPSGTCSLDILKLGLCLDVLGLVHAGLGNPVENYCCPVLQGLLELEAAVCLCTAIKLKVLNLNIYIPLALRVLITCGKDPPPGYLCPL